MSMRDSRDEPYMPQAISRPTPGIESRIAGTEPKQAESIEPPQLSEPIAQPPCDGPPGPSNMSPPPSSPPEEKFSGTGAADRCGGFRARPDLRWRHGQSTHANVRVLPKPPGWRPFHPHSKLSADDVIAIRHATES